MRKIILLNGPPRCGKDTAANYIAERYDALHMKHAALLQRAVAAAFQVPALYWHTQYEERKDEPWPELEGMSPREAMIWMSEEVLKPKFGHQYFGRKLAQHISSIDHELFVVSDCGFQDEQDPVADLFGLENCLLIRIHRPGCSFLHDSRSFIELPCMSVDLYNMEGLPELHRAIDTAIGEFQQVVA